MIMKPQKTHGRGKSGTRKYGRDLEKCKKYRLTNRREENKARKLAKRERKFERRRKHREKKKIIAGGIKG